MTFPTWILFVSLIGPCLIKSRPMISDAARGALSLSRGTKVADEFTEGSRVASSAKELTETAKLTGKGSASSAREALYGLRSPPRRLETIPEDGLLGAEVSKSRAQAEAEERIAKVLNMEVDENETKVGKSSNQKFLDWFKRPKKQPKPEPPKELPQKPQPKLLRSSHVSEDGKRALARMAKVDTDTRPSAKISRLLNAIRRTSKGLQQAMARAYKSTIKYARAVNKLLKGIAKDSKKSWNIMLAKLRNAGRLAKKL